MQQPVAIVGAGRMGRGLALALSETGAGVTLLGRAWEAAEVSPAGLVVIATPDDAIGGVAAELARRQVVTDRHVVLHLSGLLDRLALHALAHTGAGLGSFHPLQSIADPATARERLAGAFAGLEGDDRALAAGEALAAALGMHPVRLAPGTKPAYHAGAVFASNYLVVLADAAARLARGTGMDTATALTLCLPLMRGTLDNLSRGAASALTGPVRRGDAATLQRHLSVLSPDDRALYRTLGLAALRLAREAGLAAGPAAAVERVLREPE